jgi:hypothetical protein
VEHRQDTGHWKPAPRLLISWLTEMSLQLWGIQHGKRRTISQKGTMAAQPKTGGMRVRNEGLDQSAQYGFVDPQRQVGSREAICRGSECATGQERDVLKGRITVEHLDDEPVDDRRWCQKAISPAVTGLPAAVVNRFVVEVARKVLSKLANRGNNPLMHLWASCPMGLLRSTMVPGGPYTSSRLAIPS